MSGPYAVVMRFQARRPISPPLPEGVHASFLDLVRRLDPALGEVLHAPGHRLRPYTLAQLGRRGTTEFILRVGVVAPDIFQRFWDRWERCSGASLRLNSQRLRPLEVRRDGPWAGSLDWSGFASFSPVRQVTLTFCTPTTFRQGDVDLPLPVPRLILSGLFARWNASAPWFLELDPRLFESDVVLGPARLRTVPVWDGRARIWGFVGRAELRVKASAPRELAKGVAILAAFAFFSGVGRRTTHGFGLVRHHYAA